MKYLISIFLIITLTSCAIKLKGKDGKPGKSMKKVTNKVIENSENFILED